MDRCSDDCISSDEDFIAISFRLVKTTFHPVRQATDALLAVWPNKIFFPSSVTVGRLEYGSPFA
jgi:hypothetical protein